MIKLDKIKIVSSIDYIKIIDENRFDIYCKENDIVSYKFTQIQPYLLYVEANIKNQELCIFLSQLSDKQKLLNHFEGKVRFEMNLNSKEQIRKALHITDLSIMSFQLQSK